MVKVLILTDDVLQVRYERWREAVDIDYPGNVLNGAFVTAGRLRLYSELEALGEQFSTTSTDSVIYTTREGEPEVEVENLRS